MLSVRGVHKKFEGERSKWALKGINFSSKPGNHIFVIGETGSGKSTLLKCIFGIYDLDKGNIKWNGERILGPSEQLIAGNPNMRLVEQEYKLSTFKTLEANLLESLPLGLYKKEQKERISEMLSLFELEGMGNKKPFELSGGQQQRAAIAKAFINLPSVLLLDEPFAHFDPQMRNKVFEFLHERIEKEHLLVITVTHDFYETLKNADLVMVVEKGKIIQSGASQELYGKPINLYVAGLLGEYNEVVVGQNKYFVRPEELAILDKGKYKAEIVNIRFCGHFIEITLLYKGVEIKSFAHLKFAHKIGDKVLFDFPLKSPTILPTGEIVPWN
ncbi:MAG: ABC transporter ATP-binding protein [Flavobacteriales bacterium]|nr:ABC transporter ATP-binding protein [Flavobacteriales bacterium]